MYVWVNKTLALLVQCIIHLEKVNQRTCMRNKNAQSYCRKILTGFLHGVDLS